MEYWNHNSLAQIAYWIDDKLSYQDQSSCRDAQSTYSYPVYELPSLYKSFLFDPTFFRISDAQLWPRQTWLSSFHLARSSLWWMISKTYQHAYLTKSDGCDYSQQWLQAMCGGEERYWRCLRSSAYLAWSDEERYWWIVQHILHLAIRQGCCKFKHIGQQHLPRHRLEQ